MNKSTEYQIYIGFQDSQHGRELISESELRTMISDFFKRNKTDFSILSAKGGYISNDGVFVSENSLCINIIGASEDKIIRLAKNLSMFMNQECSLIVKNIINADFC